MLRAVPDVHLDRRRRTRRVAVAAVVALSSMLAFAGTAVAHSGLAAASPGPDTTVGGEIALIELFYGDLIVDFDAELVGPDGAVVEAEPAMLSEITAELRLAEPLTEPGEYELRHTIVSFDDDVVESSYTFTYDVAAPPPILVFIEETEGSGWPWWVWTLLGALALVIVVLTVRLVLALRRAQRSGSE